ncbi:MULTISPECIES: lipocalin family protein [Variovorax]|jgi:apolipoprotein D and lipocalin family protein|uniref:lipocalin family protein n=1 Tax=Variovorax TaxID=34072 RepID=UPI00089A71B1|nr:MULTISPECIES: lipocalin family protein [Variovorax]MDQ0080102.1 apolipoprotein D and lipocalin family protein [Variovorax boronicumulans]SDW18162.1 apolipoprotein D and lipocalin family protein [Variovorax sp. YR634]SDY26357.1 apolipoprotein D and lipocalin family protein [Variovorax sp. YR266]SOD30102.1 apolipoprotein D and lipocalin family protein [Variovorax sp. YR752]
MTPRTRADATTVRPFDDRRTSNAIGAMATAFVVGGVATWFAMDAARTARARPAGPADGAPLMRAPLQVVAPVDLQRYAGIWHEQARLPNRFQKQCAGPVVAEYTPQPGGAVQVLNRCVREDGNFDEAVGAARVVPVAGQPGAGRLQVRFAPAWLGWLPMVWGDYWILKLDRDYQVSLVGTPDRQYLWVLSRAPRLDEAVLRAELDYARSLGFDTDKVVLTGR